MPSANAANRAAIPQQLSPIGTPIGNWFRPDGGAETDRRVASFTIEPREIEWIRSTSNEVSKFGVSTTTTRDNPRRCYRTSTSSGYSSHSPPLSAGSCSPYATALTSKDPLYGGLAVIHESETIPWSVWSPIVYHHENRNYEGIYVCRACGCACNYSLLSPTPLFGLPPSSVIDNDNIIMPPDDISRVHPRNASRDNNNVYEYICPFWSFNGNPSTGSAPTRSNPISSEFYVNSPHRFCERSDTMRSGALLKKSKTTKCKEDGLTERSDLETRGPYIRKYHHGKPIEKGCAKLSFGLEGVRPEGCQRALASNESKYSTLECGSDVGSSCEDTVVSANDLNRRLAAASSEDLDFTLDVARAERLGRAIARAKRKRQWCRALTILLGLAFFMLSVIVVSLSVTRGRKMFGSM
ncbi:uncharacterized protein LOC109853259 isoform X2 [Pseudomyrmex gracilis]|uniref:uncharacterized protein LOC109853259 isoform X2 n=1 Tax=Pseudomyrmex gracilis TaxID=219809 RepID=UPI0009952665|nr:uncharacterized protein LOC109853259 isoform X2 [Pseudomyrmex gracilis]